MHYNRKMTTALFYKAYPLHCDAFKQLVQQDVQRALNEDVGTGDLTAQLIPATQMATAHIITREPAIICGMPWATAAFKQIEPSLQITWHVTEGDLVQPNQLLCEITGQARALLTAERCALNFLQLLSAVATETAKYVKAIAHTQAQILDTRKTIPGLRLAEKYAVTIGGGQNQRLALYDGILIKENHIAAAGSIAAAMQAAFALAAQYQTPHLSIQIEVENLTQLEQALAAGANSVLLDNFNLALLAEAVKQNAGRALLEASGGVDLSTVQAIAETGVNRISIGSLTKNVQAIDLSMRIK